MEAQDVLLLGELERAYLSEIIHDDVLQLLGASLLAADTSKQAWQLGRTDMLPDQLAKLHTMLGEATGRLRQLMSDLRPYEHDAQGLEGALQRMVAAHGLHFAGEITLDVGANRTLDQVAAMFAYRSILDSLHCVRDPATISGVHIAVRAERRRVDIDVSFETSTDGPHAENAVAPSRLGFVRWRTKSLGGTLAVKRTAPRSTSLHFRLPLTP